MQDDSSSGASAQAFIAFRDSGATRKGYVGDGSTGNENIFLVSDAGDISIVGTGGTCTMTGAASGGSSFSDEALKSVTGSVSGVLGGLSELTLVNFYWNDTARETTNASTTIKHTGFLAQNVEQVFPELVRIDPENGHKTLDYGTLSMYAVQGIKELNLKLEDLATTSTITLDNASFTGRFFAALKIRLTAWFSDAANGIERVVARTFVGERAELRELCVGDVCVTEAELQEQD